MLGNDIPDKKTTPSRHSAARRSVSIRPQGRASSNDSTAQEQHATAAEVTQEKDIDALSSEFQALREANASPSQYGTLFRTLSDRKLFFVESNSNDHAAGDKGEVRTGTVKDHERGSANAVSKSLVNAKEVMREKKAADILYKTGLRDDPNIGYVYGNMGDGIIMKEYKALPEVTSMGKEMVKDVVTTILRTATEMLKHQVRHNDSKVKNIMLEQDGDVQTPQIIDFGALTQASNEEEQMLGLMDYKDRQESDMKPVAEKHSKSKNPEDVERYMLQNFVLNPNIRRIDPALANNPAMLVCEILDIHQGLDPDKDMRKRARQIMTHEEELYITHGAIRFIEKGGDISSMRSKTEYHGFSRG